MSEERHRLRLSASARQAPPHPAVQRRASRRPSERSAKSRRDSQASGLDGRPRGGVAAQHPVIGGAARIWRACRAHAGRPSSRRSRPATSRTRRLKCSSARPASGKTTTIAKIAAQERARQRPAPRPGRRRRIPRRRHRAAAHLRGHPRRAVRVRRARPTSSLRTIDGGRSVRCSSTPPAARPPTTSRSDMFRRARARAATCARIWCSPATRSAKTPSACSIASRDARPSRVVLTQARRSRFDRAARGRAARARPAACRISAPASACPKILQRATPRLLAAWVMGEIRRRERSRDMTRRIHAGAGDRRIAVTSGKGGVGKTNVDGQPGGGAGAARLPRRHPRRRLRARQRRRDARPHAAASPRPRARAARRPLADIIVDGPLGVR